MPQTPKIVTVSETRVNETRCCIHALHEFLKIASIEQRSGIVAAINVLGNRRGVFTRELGEQRLRSQAAKENRPI